MVKKKEIGKYDKVMRGNLANPSRAFIGRLLSMEITEVLPLPPRVRQTIVEKETDTLVKLKTKSRKPFILHLEFQSTNDNRMPRRMAAYDYMLHLHYNLEVKSIVIYIGQEALNTKNYLSFFGNYYSYQVIDIRSFEPGFFLESENAGEVLLAILASYPDNERELIINKILNKLHTLVTSPSKLEENIKHLEILSNLRSREIQELLIKKSEAMPIIYDIRRDLRFQQGKTEGKVEGMLKAKELAAKQKETIIKNLLQYTDHSIEEIARLVDVTPGFVTAIQQKLEPVKSPANK